MKKFKPGDIIVAGTNFGCGSSREHAAITLKAVGAGAVLAESFGRIFFRNAINLGVPVITCSEITKIVAEGDEVEVDIEAGVIKNITTGATAAAVPMSPYIMNILQSGGIKPMIRAMQEAKIVRADSSSVKLQCDDFYNYNLQCIHTTLLKI